jgi:intracellular multiplication protein IcmJ
MHRIPVILGIARQSGSPQTSKKGPAGAVPKSMTAEIKKAVFERDDYTCQCCGFRSEKYQDIHFLDHDRHNLNMENLATTCIFCHQCFNLDMVHKMRSGVLIWLPEIAQTDLHDLARAIYVARISQGPMAEAARKALDVIMARREDVKRRIGTDDPFVLATVLKDYLTNRHYADRAQKLDGVRLFPLDRRIIREADLEFNQFPQILAYWRSKDGPFGHRAPSIWLEIYKDIMRQSVA